MVATRLLGVVYFVIHAHTGLKLRPLKSCFNEVDTLKLMVFSPVLWQMLTLCPTGTEENSSKFAGNGQPFYNRTDYLLAGAYHLDQMIGSCCWLISGLLPKSEGTKLLP